MWPFLVIGVLFAGALLVVSILLITAAWRLSLPRVDRIEVGDYPAEALDRQKNLGAMMEAAGFVFVGMQVERRGPHSQVWQALFRTGNGVVWGVVEATANERPRIVFHTFFANGEAVTTSDGEFSDYQVTGDWQLTEGRFESLKEHAIRHHQVSSGVGAEPLALKTASAFREKYLETAGRELGQLRRIGFLRKDGQEDEFKVKPWRQPRVAFRMLLHWKRYTRVGGGDHREETRRAERDGGNGGEEPDKDPGGPEYLAHYRRDRQTGTALSLLGWTIPGAILFASIVALLVVCLSSGVIDLTTVGIIAGVLLVHELGHVALMRVFGYRDLSILFIPLIGRLARNRRIRVPAWQEFVVLLMGPLPGLVVGWGLLMTGCFVPSLPEFWQQVGFWAALINNVNFLAVFPYDGGRIVNLLVFDRIRSFRLVYLLLSSFSVIVLVTLTLWSMGPAAVAVLSPFLVIGISAFLVLPEHVRHARMAPLAARSLSPGLDRTDALMKAFRIVEEAESRRGLRRRGWTDFVDAVVKYGCSKKLGVLGTAGALVVFLACLITPVWVFLGMAMGEGVLVRSEHRELQQRIDHLAPNVSWGGAVVTRKTREELEALRNSHQVSLQTLYSDDLPAAREAVDYDSRGIFDPSEALDAVRNLRWNEVSTWVAEAETEARQETVRVLVNALIGDAREQAAAGNTAAAVNGFSKAYWAISTCEPKTSLGAWIDWLYLENSLLQEIEDLMGRSGIPRQYYSWFASTVRGRPRFEGKKMAMLLLYDLQGSSKPLPSRVRDSKKKQWNLKELFADAGFALRRSEADRDLRRQGGVGRHSGISLGRIMSAIRIVQGLPTRAEYQAGIAVAGAWENGAGFDPKAPAELEDPEQRQIWEGRIGRIQRLQHYRLLAVAAFEIELSTLQSEQDPAGATATLPIRTALVTTPGNKFAVTSRAPDGTRFSWQLSPQFAIRRRTH